MLYYADRISDNIRMRNPEGYLICANVPIARSGTQDYYQDELGQDGEEIVKVFRPEEEVFSEATIASFEGMPVTNDHPDDAEGVTIENITYLRKGHCQNVRRGVGKDRDLLIADLFIDDPDTIREILDNNKREISCGYTYELCEEDGRYVQRQIRGNHIAIVDRGRAGHRVCIKDSAPIDERSKTKMAKNGKKNHIGILSKMLARFAVDAEPEELEEAVDAVEEITGTAEIPAEPAPEEKTTDEDPMEARLKALEDSIAELKKAQDEPEEPAEEEDPLAKLEADLDALEGEEAPEEEDPVNPDEDPDEQESHFVDPEIINEQDEEDMTGEAEEVEFEESADCKARDAMREAIKAVKPFIAKLPKAEQKKASDALASRLRKAYGMTDKAEKNGYTQILKARKKAGDSKKGDPTDLGKSIMASRNPNYTK